MTLTGYRSDRGESRKDQGSRCPADGQHGQVKTRVEPSLARLLRGNKTDGIPHDDLQLRHASRHLVLCSDTSTLSPRHFSSSLWPPCMHLGKQHSNSPLSTVLPCRRTPDNNTIPPFSAFYQLLDRIVDRLLALLLLQISPTVHRRRRT